MRRSLPALACLSLLLAGCTPDVPNLDSPGTTIVCFGDSITAGVGAGPGESYPERLAGRLGVPVINAGVPGDTAAAGLERLDGVLEHDPWLVIVGLGGNDLLHRIPPERTEAALDEILRRLIEARVVPLVIELEGPPMLGDLEPVFGRLEARHGVPLVEDVLDDVLLDPSLKSDTIHPNAAGYAVLADAVADRVEPLLDARRGMR